jgi:hypothetical protein
MPEVSACPDLATLERFLLGTMGANDAEAIEAHLEQCTSCVATLNTFPAHDTVVAAIQSPGSIVEPLSDAVQRLADRLKGLQRATATHDRTEASGSTTVTKLPASTASTASTAIYDFLAPAAAAHELGCLGQYRVRKVLGAGGMGVVFQAYDPDLDRNVALKAMLPTLAATPSAKRRFLREARAAAAIKHDHVVSIYQVGEDRGTPFLAMELLDGESLGDRLARGGRLPLADTLRIGREVALALAAAHHRDLIHRDIKPGNIWLESRPGAAERVKLLDFGLARATADDAQLTQAGTFVGTPAYMAPEQFQGGPVDGRSDLFSLGCVLYRMATGEQPFQGADSIAMLLAVTTQTPRPPEDIDPTLPPALCALIMALLAKQPDERPASAQTVVEALNAIERGEHLLSSAVPAPRRAAARSAIVRPAAPRRWRSMVAAAVVLALVGAGGYLCGPTIMRWACNEGELVIVIDDSQVQAVLDQTSVTIRDRAKDREYRIKPVPQPVTSGTYLLEVTEAGGDMRLFTKEFTIVRGGQTTVRVTFDPKRLMSRTVVGTGAAPTNLYSDRAHSLVDVVDFRDIAGATAKEFNDWRAALDDDFRLAWVSTRKGKGPTLFNAVAVREKTPRLVRCFPELSADKGERLDQRMGGDNYYRDLTLCRSAAPAPNDKSPWVQTHLMVKDGLDCRTWFGPLGQVTGQIAKEKAAGFRLCYLEAFSSSAELIYDSILVADPTRAWKPFYTLGSDELVTTIRSYEEKGWRPDVIAPDWDGRHLRFMLVAVDNRDGVDWRFRMDMRLKQYQEESGKQQAAGLFPLALVSYGDDADVKYAAIWVRYRAPGAPLPAPPTADPQVQVDRAVQAVSWTGGGAVKHSFADRAHVLAEVLDWRDLAGASLTELRDWAAALGPDWHVSAVSNRRGTGTALFNAVAVREKQPLPFRFHAGINEQDALAEWQRQIDDGYQAVDLCASPDPDAGDRSLWTRLWVKDGPPTYTWGDTWEPCRTNIGKWTADARRPTFLEGPPVPDGTFYLVIMPEGQGRPWQGQYSVAADELVSTIEYYRRKGWRPDVLAPHWKGDQLRFMLVAVDNPEPVDWRFRMHMSLEQYRTESAEQKRRGLFPLTVVSYGNDAQVQYAAIWVRYRAADATQ